MNGPKEFVKQFSQYRQQNGDGEAKRRLVEAGAYVESSSGKSVVLSELGVVHVYITMGADGVYCCKGSEEQLFPILPGDMVNTTGAGDAFLAGVVYAHAKGLAFPQTAQYGLMAARAALMSPKAVNPEIANILL